MKNRLIFFVFSLFVMAFTLGVWQHAKVELIDFKSGPELISPEAEAITSVDIKKS